MTGSRLRTRSSIGISRSRPLYNNMPLERYYNERRYSAKREINALKVNDRVFRNVTLDHFEAESPLELGRGGNSSVQCYRHNASGTIMALKRTRIGQPDELDSKTKVTRDIEHLRKLRGHSNIITLYGYFEVCGEAYICMEKMECCFAKVLLLCAASKQRVPTRMIGSLCYAVASALCALKENKIIHRDIKPANILLDRQGTIKLSDFGGSGFLYDSYSFSDPTITNCYAAPERIDCDHENSSSKSAFTCAADVWSLGVSALELATQMHPFASKDNNAFVLMDKLLNQPAPQLLTTELGYDADLADFISRCLEKSPTQRMYPKLKSNRYYIMKHPFVAPEGLWCEKQVAAWYNKLVET